MNSATEIMGKMAGKREYRAYVAKVGAANVKTESDDLTPGQTAFLDLVAGDPGMDDVDESKWKRYKELKTDPKTAEIVANAEPWY